MRFDPVHWIGWLDGGGWTLAFRPMKWSSVAAVVWILEFSNLCGTQHMSFTLDLGIL